MHRYSGLGYVALNVSDVERSRFFYEDLFGLQGEGYAEDGSRFLRCSDNHHDLVLCEGKPGLKRVGWRMESDADIDRLAEAVTKAGIAVQEVDPAEQRALHIGRAIRFTCPFTGVTHEGYAEMARATEPWQPSVAKIQRIGHLVLRTPKYEEAVRFYLDVLNFRISDAVGSAVSFLRCFPNPFHHSLGLGNAGPEGGARLHHVNFMVSEVDDIGKALWRFKKHDVPVVRGPGRHPPSDSMFLYVLDPDGLTMEYSFGMEEFPENDARDHRVLPMVPESIDFWGAPTDKRLGSIGEIEPFVS